PKGGFHFPKFPISGLEEDHATDLEEVEVFEPIANPVAGSDECIAAEAIGTYTGPGTAVKRATKAALVEVKLEMLPVEEHMHRSRVDLLHDTGAPAVHGRASDGHTVKNVVAIEVCLPRGDRSATAVEANVGNKAAALACELVLILTALAIDDSC